VYKNSLDVLSLNNIKDAALYFDRVIPVQCDSLRHDADEPYVTVPEVVPAHIVSKLIYGNEAPDWKVGVFMVEAWAQFIKKLHEEFKEVLPSETRINYGQLYENNIINNKGISIRDNFHEFAASFGVNKSSILIQESHNHTDFETAYINVSLKGIELINSKKATWDQIMELRSDKTAHNSLRNLRLFIYENYTGKPTAYIYDDISKRLDDYENVAQKHGFELKTSVLSTLLDSKSIQASLAAGLAVGLFSGAELGLSAACAVELGKGSLEIAKQLHGIKSFKHNHDLAYLIRAKELIK